MPYRSRKIPALKRCVSLRCCEYKFQVKDRNSEPTLSFASWPSTVDIVGKKGKESQGNPRITRGRCGARRINASIPSHYGPTRPCVHVCLSLTQPSPLSHSHHALARVLSSLKTFSMKFLPIRMNRKQRDSEQAPLLDHKEAQSAPLVVEQPQRRSNRNIAFRFIAIMVIYWAIMRGVEFWADGMAKKFSRLPSDPHEAAKRILEKAPVIVSINPSPT